jgi:hypothetical protein
MSNGWIDSQGTDQVGPPPTGYWVASDGRWYPPQGSAAPHLVPKKKRAKWPWVLLAVLVLGLGGCIAIVASAGQTISDAVDDYDEDQAAQKTAVEGAVTITECRIDEITGFGKASLEFVNPLDETKGYISIEISFLDGDTVVGSGSVLFENLAPGQKAKADATSIDVAGAPASVTCKVVDSSVL